VRSSDFFIENDIESPWVSPPLAGATTTFNEALLVSLRREPLADTSDVSAALGLLDLVHEELEAYGTAGGQQLTDPQIALAIHTLQSVIGR
jgi:hypothetical protein